MKKSYVKEIIILILLLIVILFTTGILFYDFWPTKSDLKELDYIDDLGAIDENYEIEQDVGSNKTNSEELVLKSYSIDKDTLNTYEKEKSYKSGKKDPFSEASDPVDGSIETKITSAQQEKNNGSNSVKIDNNIKTETNTIEKNKNEKVQEKEKNKIEDKEKVKDKNKEKNEIKNKATNDNKQSNGFLNNHGLK